MIVALCLQSSIFSLQFSACYAQSDDDIELTDSTSTGWDDGTGGNVNPNTPDETVTGMTISQTTLTLEGGETVRLTASVNQSAMNKKILWSSANPRIASVDDEGRVRGRTMGMTTITATAAGNTSITKQCKVTVTSNDPTAVTEKGDVNGDGAVDIADVVAVYNIMAGNNLNNYNGDVNEDGATDIADVVAVYNIMAGGK